MSKTHCGNYIESTYYATRKCSPQDSQCDYCQLRDAEAEIEKLQNFINDAFSVYPNLDTDVENYRKS